MSLLESFRIAFYNLRLKLTRTILNMIGVGIGVAAITIIVSLGDSSQAQIKKEIDKMGADLIWVSPSYEYNPREEGEGGGDPFAARFVSQADMDAIKRLFPEIIASAPANESSAQIKFTNKYADGKLIGTTTQYGTVQQLAIKDGRFLSAGDNDHFAKVCVVDDSKASKELFGLSSPVGNVLLIRDEEFTIIGVVKAKEGSFNRGSQPTVYIPFSAFGKIFGETEARLVYFRVKDAPKVKEISEKIKKALYQRHGESVRFTVFIAADMMEFAKKTTGMLTIAFGGVAVIALLVGGIGIMNSMLASVIERTREIGILKAEGARSRDILMQFIIESILLTFLGGLAGVFIGISVNVILAPLIQLPLVISYVAIIVGLLFSIATGVASGFYPARKAARMDPIVALRYQ